MTVLSLMLCYLPYHLEAAAEGGLRFDNVEQSIQHFNFLTGIKLQTRLTLFISS